MLRFTSIGIAVSVLAFATSNALAQRISQSGEQKMMERVGHTDLQGRGAYHPNVIQYPDGRTILFVGTHTGTRLNPLTGAVERNGTFIIDVTDPARPVEKFHIPAPSGQTQSVRMCLGSDLRAAGSTTATGAVYMMRNVQGGASAGYEVYDVSKVEAPVRVGRLLNLRDTHKHWWECKSGIAYLPGSKGAPAAQWREGHAMMVVDWREPGAPDHLRTYGLVGQQPDCGVECSDVNPVPASLHGAISTYDHFDVRGNVKNRIYLAYGVGDDGVLQILDRAKLLPRRFPGGTYDGPADTPTDADILSAQVTRMDMSPDQGGHTSFPVFGLVPPSYQDFTQAKTRDVVLLASESTSDLCDEAPHWSFIVDITTETKPWNLSTMWVDPRKGAEYPRGNYCKRGARYGVHSSEENFDNPFYGRLTFLAYFTGGVRVWDIREPQGPVEVGFYVPESNANTTADGYMTNNLEVDNRGYVYAVDRNGAGLDILQVTGKLKQLAR
jgi:hypothetical protein